MLVECKTHMSAQLTATYSVTQLCLLRTLLSLPTECMHSTAKRL